MKQWICKVCGYTQSGDSAPERCPRCGSPASQFKEAGKKSWNALTVFIVLALMTFIFFVFFSCRSPLTVDNSPIKAFDIKRFQGKWYEIARFNHRFERNMEYCTAVYTPKDDGTIKVTNTGKKKGEWKTVVGKGKMTETPGLLRVSFFGPFYSDYRILMLDPDYSYALVGGENDKYLWILSRTPQLEKDVKDSILKEASRRGYKTDNLVWVKQDIDNTW